MAAAVAVVVAVAVAGVWGFENCSSNVSSNFHMIFK